MRQVRFLLAWMSREEAIGTFLGRTQLANEDVAGHAAAWDAAHHALQAREPFDLATPILQELPSEMTDRANAFRARPDVLAALQGLDWTLGIADLEHVLSFQKTVVEDHALDRVPGAEANDFAGLFPICLPDPAGPINIECAVDADHKGLTFVSSNPNLRLGGHAIQQAEIPAAAGQPAQKLNVAGFIFIASNKTSSSCSLVESGLPAIT